MRVLKPKAWVWAIVVLAIFLLPGCQSRQGIGGAAGDEVVQPTAGTRHWLGPTFWGNRLQDWRFSDGRIECVTPQGWLPMRTVHDLSRQVEDAGQPFEASVVVSLPAIEGVAYSADAAAGFLIGVGNGEMDFRSASLVHHWQGPGGGMFVGLTSTGQAFIVDNELRLSLPTEGLVKSMDEPVRLVVRGAPKEDGSYELTLEARTVANDVVIASATQAVDPARVLGNVAIVSHPGTQVNDVVPGLFSFNDWSVDGEAVTYRPEQQMGPIIGSQYTLSRGTLRLSAQFLPLSAEDSRDVVLRVRRNGRWRDAATTTVNAPDYTAAFEIQDWDDTQDTPFRVVYGLGGQENTGVYAWSGTIRHDPVDEEQIVVAGFTGSNQLYRGTPRNWITHIYFPHADLTSRVEQHEPDLLFFSGDQVYEGIPTFPDRQNIMLDYQYKWAIHVWAYRDLMRDIPTVSIPDDHDVYQGNYWGEGGRRAPGADNTGGYVHPAEFVSMVHRTHTAHMPKPADNAPIQQGIPVYHCDLVWGRVSFAVLADRMFKSGCAGHGLPASGTGRPDHYNNPSFDTADLDLPGLVLLGERQLSFLDEWAADWRGAEMKLAMSQTIFANMATHHGRDLNYLIADLDSNGWPQTGRNKAVAALRRAFAMHLAGDQHLGTLIQHGIDDHSDAVWSFCVPSVANFYPRAWAPEATGRYAFPQPEQYLGDRLDGFKNRVTVYAASNPGQDMGHEPDFLHDRMPGYGIIVIDKPNRTYEAQCWPRFADPGDPSQQYEGWPRTINQRDNDGREPLGHLGQITVTGLQDYAVQVRRADNNALVYALRIQGNTFTPFVYEDTAYNVTVHEPDGEDGWLLPNLEIDGPAIELQSQ